MPTAYDIYTDSLQSVKGNRLLSFGCPILDEATGRIPTQGISEISGEAGSGKTQLCLTLALRCHLPCSSGGLSGSTAYMSCGESDFPIRRLQQLATSLETRHKISQSEFMSNVHIERCFNSDNIYESLTGRLPEMCKSQNVKLVIIDRSVYA